MMKRLIIIAFFGSLFFCSTAVAEFGQNSDYITNTYLRFKKGERIIFVHNLINGKRDYRYVDAVNTEMIDGVSCLKVIEVDTYNQTLNISWGAQGTQGNVYVLQTFDNKHEAPLFYGKDNAVLIAPATINVGDFIGGNKVTKTGVTVGILSTGLGPYANCIEAVEDDGDLVYYAPGVGKVKKVSSGDFSRSYELKEKIYILPGDLSGDNRIGLEEAIHALKTVSGLQ